MPLGGLLWPVGHWITRVGHLDQQVAVVQAPPLGLHTSTSTAYPPHPPCQLELQTQRERDARMWAFKKKADNSERERSDSSQVLLCELERLIKQAAIKCGEIIEAGIKIKQSQRKRRQRGSVATGQRLVCRFSFMKCLFEDSNNLETVFECPFSSYLRPKYNYAFIRRLQTAECGLAKAFKPAELICSTT